VVACSPCTGWTLVDDDGRMGLLTPLAIRIGAQPWMPRLLPRIVAVDTRLQRLTGRSLLDVAGLPNLTLTVRGRRSGTPRSTPLLAVPVGGSWLVAGSYFGDPRTPEWVRNLRAADGCASTEHGAVRATELEGAERDAAWETLLRTWPNFRVYQRRTDRLIPVVRLGRNDNGYR
jgi:deazaflavin-dependent oxidoreductase (nitroreductase family)